MIFMPIILQGAPIGGRRLRRGRPGGPRVPEAGLRGRGRRAGRRAEARLRAAADREDGRTIRRRHRKRRTLGSGNGFRFNL